MWRRYFEKLLRQAKKQLGNAPTRIADEEDVALSVFNSLCNGAKDGKFDQLKDRDDLWKLLVAITRMKSVDQIRFQSAKKRGGVDLRGESVLGSSGDTDAPMGLDQFFSDEPTPQTVVEVEEQRQVLMESLSDDSQRRVAQFRLDGYLNNQIAEEMKISIRSVERKLQVVRQTWLQFLTDAAQ